MFTLLNFALYYYNCFFFLAAMSQGQGGQTRWRRPTQASSRSSGTSGSCDSGPHPAPSHCCLLGKPRVEPGGAGSELFEVMTRAGREGEEVTITANLNLPPRFQRRIGVGGPDSSCKGTSTEEHICAV